MSMSSLLNERTTFERLSFSALNFYDNRTVVFGFKVE